MTMQQRKNFSWKRRRLLILSEWKIPLSDLDYGAEEEAAVVRVLRNNWLSMGPEVQAFEKEFAELLGVKHAIAVANGTAALHLSYLALGLGSGDEIIQPALNFVAAANMTVAVGASPVFADILSLEEPTIDPSEIERQITPRTKAIVVMHYGGYPCRMADILAICQRHGLALIEDACHAPGVHFLDPQERTPHGKMVGNLGDVACFSFFSNKNLASGEGGMVTTNRDDLAERLRLLRSHGMTTLTWDRYKGHASSYDVVLNGYNYRFDEIHAALGRVQLRKLLSRNEHRRNLLSLYHKKLISLSDWILPFASYTGETAGHLMIAVAPTPESRKYVVSKLHEDGVQTSMHYPCVPDFSEFRRWRTDVLPISRTFAKRAMSLPLFPNLQETEVNSVCQVIAGCLDDPL